MGDLDKLSSYKAESELKLPHHNVSTFYLDLRLNNCLHTLSYQLCTLPIKFNVSRERFIKQQNCDGDIAEEHYTLSNLRQT